MKRVAKIVLSAIVVLVSVTILPSACDYTATVKVGALRTLDAMPLSLGLYKPIFEENHLTMQPTYFDTPAQLREAFIRGEIDAAIMDLPGALTCRDIKIVRVALKAWSGRTFAILVAPHTSATVIPTLQNADIAVCDEASHRYVADSLLNQAGVRSWTEVQTRSPDETLQMLLDGKTKAALLPEPQATMAVARGAHVIIDDADKEFSQTMVVFREQLAANKPAVIRRFLTAYEQSVRELNVRGENYRPLLTIIGIPAEVSASIALPVFPFPGEVPCEDHVAMINGWLIQNRMLAQPAVYKEVVNGGFLGNPSQFRPAVCCGW